MILHALSAYHSLSYPLAQTTPYVQLLNDSKLKVFSCCLRFTWPFLCTMSCTFGSCPFRRCQYLTIHTDASTLCSLAVLACALLPSSLAYPNSSLMNIPLVVNLYIKFHHNIYHTQIFITFGPVTFIFLSANPN